MAVLKDFLRKTIYSFLSYMPGKKVILFESVPDYADNTKAVFDEMVRREIYKSYDLVWVLHADNPPENFSPYARHISFKHNNCKARCKQFILNAKAKCMICCNGFLLPVRKEQKSFFLSHGTPIKSVRNYYTVPRAIDYVFTASEGTNSVVAYEFDVDPRKLVPLGFPRNDVLTTNTTDIHALFDNNFSKIIVWYPTYRQHKNGLQTESKSTLPLLDSIEDATILNEYAKENSTLLVVKPHFAQNTAYLKTHKLSNILFIDDQFYQQHSLSSYEFIAGCDALITDYSSVYFDYLLCDKPMGAVLTDIEEYKKNPGFAIDVDYYLKGAERINSIGDFICFIRMIASGEDRLKQERNEICEWANIARDRNNTKRVVDFIVGKANI